MGIKNLHSAVFLDRDGTINEDVGDFCSLDKLIFIPRAFEALRMLQRNYLLFIITNQSGIGKGFFSERDLLQFNAEFYAVLKEEGISIKQIYYCPHTKEKKCHCRKPSPYFLKIAEKGYDINLKNSYVIGDHPHDMEMAHKVGAGSVYLLTGHGRKHKQELLSKPDFIANDIYRAAVWIINNHRPKGGTNGKSFNSILFKERKYEENG